MVSAQFLNSVVNDSLSPISDYLNDSNVSEIMINPGGRVFVELDGKMISAGQLFNENTIRMALTVIAKSVGQDALSRHRSSIITASVGQLRISGALYPVCPDGSFMTIRKHHDKGERPTLEQLVSYGTLSEKQAEILVDAIIKKRRNAIFSGGTGTGKTTLINAILAKIPAHERVITVEDARELSLNVDNGFSIVTDPDAGIHARLAIQTLLRQRPDRIIVGETRGEETYDLIRALNSGHLGSMSSIHANSSQDALDCLEMLFQQSLPNNARIDGVQVRHLIARAVHILVHVDREVIVHAGKMRVYRKIKQICAVDGVDANGIIYTREITDYLP